MRRRVVRAGSRREVAEKLNRRPRETLGFATPADKLAALIAGREQAGAER
jgi:IS30 family transposase